MYVDVDCLSYGLSNVHISTFLLELKIIPKINGNQFPK